MRAVFWFTVGVVIGHFLVWAADPAPEQDIPSYVPGTIKLEGSAHQ